MRVGNPCDVRADAALLQVDVVSRQVAERSECRGSLTKLFAGVQMRHKDRGAYLVTH
jgi:hypothetical protein